MRGGRSNLIREAARDRGVLRQPTNRILATTTNRRPARPRLDQIPTATRNGSIVGVVEFAVGAFDLIAAAPADGRRRKGPRLSPNERLLVTDNDFSVEGARTRFWRVKLKATLA